MLSWVEFVDKVIHAVPDKVDVFFEPRDLWLGLYWTREEERQTLKVYICLIPMFPIYVEWNDDWE
jgi:hypothetical protein